MKVSGARIGGLTKEMRVAWQETKHYWKDAKSQEFGHKYMEELFASVDRAVTVIEELDKLLTKIKTDCE